MTPDERKARRAEQQKAYQKTYRERRKASETEADHEQRRVRDRAYYAATQDDRREQQQASYWRNHEARLQDMRNRSADTRAQANFRDRVRLRFAGFDRYGWVCACCGENNWKFLTFDHPNGDGAQDRKELAGSYFNASSSTVLRSLRQQGFPEGALVVLCWNCNSGRAYNGGVCPHLEE